MGSMDGSVSVRMDDWNEVFELNTLRLMVEAKYDIEIDPGAYEVSVAALYGAIRETALMTPTFFEVCAEDGFYAIIPWRLANASFLRFPEVRPEDDEHGKLRLFVPDTEDPCLNVKSIIEVQFGDGASRSEPRDPIYGSKLHVGSKIT